MISMLESQNARAMHAALLSVIFKKIIFYFQMWRDTVAVLRVEEEQEKSANSLSHAKQIMKNSVRGQRSMVEQDALAEVLSTLSCVPKMSSMDMDLLTNNIECIDCTGRTLIFLQGDFGACFYIIATGNIELYLEPSKDKEMSNCRNFGVFRGNSFDLEQCGALGRHIVTLKAGQGFGEYAILSSTHKFRGASAVAADDCLLFIVYADTYNATLRKHHFRQQQMSSAIALLKELPIFNFQSNAKIAQFAYNLRCQTYSPRTIIARASAKINTLYLISSGAIKVVSNKSTEYEEEQQDELSMHVGLTKRLDLCALEFGRGQIIGLWEILKDQSVYDMTYITSASCELLEISSQYFQEVMSASKKIPARPGEWNHQLMRPVVRSISSRVSHEQKTPVFTTSMRATPHTSLSRKYTPDVSLPTPPVDSFYSTIRKAADFRENVHCSRLSRVQEAFGGNEKHKHGPKGIPDRRSILNMFTEAVPTSNVKTHTEQSSRHVSIDHRNSQLCKKNDLPAAVDNCVSRRIGDSPSLVTKTPILQQYRNAVFHHTEASSTNVVSISSNENTMKMSLTNSIVKSELLATSPVPCQPIIRFPKSRINNSPNKRHREVVTENI